MRHDFNLSISKDAIARPVSARGRGHSLSLLKEMA
jgi:hypothetical protein